MKNYKKMEVLVGVAKLYSYYFIPELYGYVYYFRYFDRYCDTVDSLLITTEQLEKKIE